jgi:transmembrane sensor
MDPQTRRYYEAADWLFRLQEDSPSTEQIIQWVEWCCADPENRRAFEHLMPVWQALELVHADPAIASMLNADRSRVSAAPTPNPSPDDIASIHTEAPRQRNATLRRRRFAIAALAASLLVSVGLLALWRTSGTLTLAPVADFASTIGEVREANLPDGSHIDLGGRSNVAINFLGAKRQIEVRDGEAFFAVKHDRTRPFTVQAGLLQVVAVGTAFDVLRNGDRITVTVQEGVVTVTAPGSHAGTYGPPQTLPIRRGSQFIFDAASPARPTMRSVDPESAESWRKGRFEYVNEPLSSVVASLNRYSTDRIALQDERLGGLSYTGTVELRSIDEWLRALPSIFPIQVEFGTDHRITLLPRAGA